jgi:hypothetical protein
MQSEQALSLSAAGIIGCVGGIGMVLLSRRWQEESSKVEPPVSRGGRTRRPAAPAITDIRVAASLGRTGPGSSARYAHGFLEPVVDVETE